MTPAESERHFDDLLRQRLAGREVQPSAALWPVVGAAFPVARPAARWRPLGAAAVLGLLIGVLIGWWGGVRPAEKGPQRAPNATGNDKMVVGDGMMNAGNATTTTGNAMTNVGSDKTIVGDGMMNVGSSKTTTGNATTTTGSAATTTGTAASVGGKSSGGGPSLPPTAPTGRVLVPAVAPDTATRETASLWQIALTQDAAIRTEAVHTLAPGPGADSTSRVPALMVAQRATLHLLQHRLDSLKAHLPAEPPVLVVVAPPVAEPAVDSAARPAPALPPARWSLLLLTQATSRWGSLPGATADFQQNLGPAATRSLALEYRLPTADRWSLRAGLGETRVTGLVQAARERTGQRLVSDTVTSSQLTAVTRRDTTLILHEYTVYQYNPIINASGQVDYYDTVPEPHVDTLYQVIVSHDTVRTSTRTVQTRLDTWRERFEQQLRPTYRFWTLPLAVHYDLLRHGRWATGLLVGTQVQVFRGGDAPVRQSDGAYALRPIGPREGPFRPVSVQLTAAVDVRYRLTDRLSLLAAGGGAGWLQSPVRGAARGPVQLTGQAGVSWNLADMRRK